MSFARNFSLFAMTFIVIAIIIILVVSWITDKPIHLSQMTEDVEKLSNSE